MHGTFTEIIFNTLKFDTAFNFDCQQKFLMIVNQNVRKMFATETGVWECCRWKQSRGAKRGLQNFSNFKICHDRTFRSGENLVSISDRNLFRKSELSRLSRTQKGCQCSFFFGYAHTCSHWKQVSSSEGGLLIDQIFNLPNHEQIKH